MRKAGSIQLTEAFGVHYYVHPPSTADDETSVPAWMFQLSDKFVKRATVQIGPKTGVDSTPKEATGKEPKKCKRDTNEGPKESWSMVEMVVEKRALPFSFTCQCGSKKQK